MRLREHCHDGWCWEWASGPLPENSKIKELWIEGEISNEHDNEVRHRLFPAKSYSNNIYCIIPNSVHQSPLLEEAYWYQLPSEVQVPYSPAE